MKDLKTLRSNGYIQMFLLGKDGGRFDIKMPGGIKLFVIASFGGGWDHVSVSLRNRCPTWDEMCFIKNMFFEENECVIQYHPPKSEYVNNHPYVLHMWKPQQAIIPMPPSIMVGIKGVEFK